MNKIIQYSFLITKFFLISFTVFATAGCDAVYKLIDRSGAEEKALLGDLLPFESHEIVRKVQIYLQIVGYYKSKVDGVLGPGTRRSLRRFQTDLQIPETGFIDQETYSHLFWIAENEFLIEDQLNVALIQQLLKQKGFDVGVVDGQMGPRTKRALQAFQTQYSLPEQTGEIDYFTLIFLIDR